MALSAEYLPALEIGGDFYDTIPLAGDKIGILVADVTGHGIQAALSTAVVKFAFSDYKNCECSATEIITGMNKILLRALPEETFAAAMVVILDTKTSECRLANGGLPHPFLLHRQSKDAERIAANGFMLGVIDEALFKPEEEHTLQLSKGDFLMVYTDGVSEAQNVDGVPFDQGMLTEQLVTHADLSGPDLSKKLIAASKKFSDPNHPWDDITILGIDVL